MAAKLRHFNQLNISSFSIPSFDARGSSPLSVHLLFSKLGVAHQKSVLRAIVNSARTKTDCSLESNLVLTLFNTSPIEG